LKKKKKKTEKLNYSKLLPTSECPFFSGIETVGKNVLVVGHSKNVGMPIAMLLHSDRNHERPGGEICVITLLLLFFFWNPIIYK